MSACVFTQPDASPSQPFTNHSKLLWIASPLFVRELLCLWMGEIRSKLRCWRYSNSRHMLCANPSCVCFNGGLEVLLFSAHFASPWFLRFLTFTKTINASFLFHADVVQNQHLDIFEYNSVRTPFQQLGELLSVVQCMCASFACIVCQKICDTRISYWTYKHLMKAQITSIICTDEALYLNLLWSQITLFECLPKSKQALCHLKP